MDQLHEELKEHVEEECDFMPRQRAITMDNSSDEEEGNNNGCSSQSDAEYETCDSGVSEQSSLSDEGERGTKRRYSRVSQSDKLRSKFTSRSIKKSNNADEQQQQQLYAREQPAHSIGSNPNSPSKHHVGKKLIKTRSIISDIFDGKLLSSVQCLTCKRVSTRVETFQDLSLPIPTKDHLDMMHKGIFPQKSTTATTAAENYEAAAAAASNNNATANWFGWLFSWLKSWIFGPVIGLTDCLSAFFSADELKGDNMYSCEKCDKLRNGVKFSKVLELPEILCIHLKRFRHELMFSTKITHYVSFPLKGLNMKEFLHKDCVSGVTMYDLISVICHHGTAGAGHYTCYAYNELSAKWFEFDDQSVTEVPSDTVKNCEAYVLFYKKTSLDIQDCRDNAMKLMECEKYAESEGFKYSSSLHGQQQQQEQQPVPGFPYFVSRRWIHRFNTFAEPGPIDNSDFLCPHGGLDPVKSLHQIVEYFCTALPQSAWEYLHET